MKPGARVHLSKVDPGDAHGVDEARAKEQAAKDLARLQTLQEMLFAERRHRMLIVLQGIDTSGKDGVIKHLSKALHPLGTPGRIVRRPHGARARSRLPVADPRTGSGETGRS